MREKNPDHLKPKYFNPDSVLQKSGMEVMWNCRQGKCIWYIFVRDRLCRNFAVHLDVRLQSRK